MIAIQRPYNEDAFKVHHRKEKHFYKDLSYFQKDTGSRTGFLLPAFTVRFYKTASRIYCCIWGQGMSASGSAGGYGYDRESAAFADAAEKLFIFDENISGVGAYAIDTAVAAIICARSGYNGEIYCHTAAA